MSHANKADKLLIKPTAGARPGAAVHTPDDSFRKTRETARLTPRRVTSDTRTTIS